MKDTRLLMGMPITVNIIDPQATKSDLNDIYNYFSYIDHKFSVFKPTSEVSWLNSGQLARDLMSDELRLVLALAEQTKQETNGYFDIYQNGYCNPSGLVKGWAIYNAVTILEQKGFKNFCVDAGGDMQVTGFNQEGELWRIGIRHPFEQNKLVKVLGLTDLGIATSGTYIRGQHVYNPLKLGEPLTEIVSLTVVGPNIYEADRFATAAFVMGRAGLDFIATKPGLEGYMIDKDGQATFTEGFSKFTI